MSFPFLPLFSALATFVFAALFAIYLLQPPEQSPRRVPPSDRTPKENKRKVSFNAPHRKGLSESEASLIDRLNLTLNADKTCVISLALDSRMLDSSSGERLESLGRVISELGNVSNLFLLLSAPSDDIESEIMNQLATVLPDSFGKHRIIFFQSEIGKVAIVRQLKSLVHIDYSEATCEQMSKYIRSVTHYADSKEEVKVALPSSKFTRLQYLEKVLSLSFSLSSK